jgi:hypothetical protein
MNTVRRRRKNKPAGKVALIAWSIAMIMILFFVVDAIFQTNILSYDFFIFIIHFFSILLNLIILSWILIIRNRYQESSARVDETLRKLIDELDRLDNANKTN